MITGDVLRRSTADRAPAHAFVTLRGIRFTEVEWKDMVQEINPALTEERAAFRASFNLRLVTDQENGSPIERLPEGIYGYTTSPATDELPVFIKPVFRCFEVHKHAGGETYWVGYVTEKEYRDFQTGSEPMTLDLYPEPYEQATKLILIQSSRVDRRKPPTRDFGNSMKMEIAPKP